MSGVQVERLPDEADEIAGHIRRGEVYTAHLDALGGWILPGLAAEIRRLRALAADAAGYVAAMHRHANRHDVLGENLGCAGCALLDRIEGAQSGRDGEAPPDWHHCAMCGERCYWQESPHGGWWAHEVHPAEGSRA